MLIVTLHMNPVAKYTSAHDAYLFGYVIHDMLLLYIDSIISNLHAAVAGIFIDIFCLSNLSVLYWLQTCLVELLRLYSEFDPP